MPNNINSESDLVKALAVGLQKNFNTDIAIREFAGGYGIADLVFAKNFLSSKNIVDRTPINNYYALKTYLSLPSNNTFSLGDAVRISGASRNITSKIINTLVANNYLCRDGNSFYKTQLEFTNPIKNLVAIEVKLRDWKQGILQARRYKSYTTECYLAILAKYEKNIDTTYLDKFDIGLILFNEKNGNILVKRKPQRNAVLSFYEDLMEIFAKELFLYQANSLKFQ